MDTKESLVSLVHKSTRESNEADSETRSMNKRAQKKYAKEYAMAQSRYPAESY